MQKSITATRAKNNFGELIRRVYTTGEQVIVEKDGLPVVMISPIYEPHSRPRRSKTIDSAPSNTKKENADFGT